MHSACLGTRAVVCSSHVHGDISWSFAGSIVYVHCPDGPRLEEQSLDVVVDRVADVVVSLGVVGVWAGRVGVDVVARTRPDPLVSPEPPVGSRPARRRSSVKRGLTSSTPTSGRGPGTCPTSRA